MKHSDLKTLATRFFPPLFALGVLCTAGPAAASPSSMVAWTTETMALIRSGDAGRGEQLANGCNACHGQAGFSVSPAFPHIDGQDATYLFKQLKDFKDSKRSNLQMNEIAAAMSEQDMADLAAYYSTQPRSSAPNPGAVDDTPLLVERGDGSRMIPACSGCHGRRGTGNRGYYGMPRLAGQKAVYMEIALREFRAGDRANDVYAVMRDITRSLTDDEISDLGAYYAAQ